MDCISCGHKMKKAENKTYHYVESGLSNVYLKGLKFSECPSCGEEYFEIPNMEDLHNLMARDIALQKNKLLGQEIRFLRSHLGFSGKDFAQHIGVKAETVSRWENNKESIGDTPEKLLRVLILSGHGPFRDYELLEEMGEIRRKTPIKRTFVASRMKWREAA